MDGEPCFTAGMVFSETSIRYGVRVQPDPSIPLEAVLLAVGDCVGYANLSHASRMNKEGVVVSERGTGAQQAGRGAHSRLVPTASVR